jgi:hypothetical protein
MAIACPIGPQRVTAAMRPVAGPLRVLLSEAQALRPAGTYHIGSVRPCDRALRSRRALPGEVLALGWQVSSPSRACKTFRSRSWPSSGNYPSTRANCGPSQHRGLDSGPHGLHQAVPLAMTIIFLTVSLVLAKRLAGSGLDAHLRHAQSIQLIEEETIA